MNRYNLIKLIISFHLPACLFGAVVQVPGTYPTLQQAILEAPSGSVIEVSPGNYAEFIQVLDLKKKLYIRSTGGPNVTTITGNGTNSLLRIENGAGGNADINVSWEGFTFQNGINTPSAGSPIVIADAKPSFLSCVFINNKSFNDKAGAVLIYGSRSAPTFSDCKFVNNTAEIQAGAVLVNGAGGTTVFKRCLFEGNSSRTASGSDWNQGGGLYIASSNAKIVDCVFRNNETRYSGGALMLLTSWDNPESQIEIIGSLFEGNFAQKNSPGAPPSEGGAIMAENNINLIIDRCLFKENNAEAGGAVHSYRANITLKNSVFYGNIATGANGLGYGGGLGVNTNDDVDSNRREPSITIENTLFKKCTGPVAGGIYISGDGAYNQPVPLTMTKVVVENCTATTTGNSNGIGGGVFLSLTDAEMNKVAILNNNADFVGGGLTLISSTSLKMNDSFVIGNRASAQDAIHNPGNLIITENNTLWAYNPNQTGVFEELWAVPPMTVNGQAYLTYFKAPFVQNVDLNPGSFTLTNLGGYSAGTFIKPTSETTLFEMAPTLQTQSVSVDIDVGGVINASYPGPTAIIPGRLQIENYDRGGRGLGYYDTDSAQIGGGGRSTESPDISNGGGADQGKFMAFIDPGEWLEFTAEVTDTALKKLSFSYASLEDSKISFQVDGTYLVKDIALPATGGWTTWSQVDLNDIALPQGIRKIRVLFPLGRINMDWLEFTNEFSDSTLFASTNYFSAHSIVDQSPRDQTLILRNLGPGTINYTLNKSESWLQLSKSDGVITDNTETIPLSFQTTGLLPNTYTDVIQINSDAVNAPSKEIYVELVIREAGSAINDFDGDGVTDIGIFRPSDVTWHIFQSTDGPIDAFQFGTLGDIPVPADYDGDGRSDIAVFRPSTVTWYVYGSKDGSMAPFQFGGFGDLPVPADYDGDGIADLAVFRPSTVMWYIYGSKIGPIEPFQFGGFGDLPVPADYDGDGVADLAVFRPSTATWYMFGSSTGPMDAFQFGTSGDIPAPGDYDGDGIADIAIFRPSSVTWYILRSTKGPVPPFEFGAMGDLPIR